MLLARRLIVAAASVALLFAPACDIDSPGSGHSSAEETNGCNLYIFHWLYSPSTFMSESRENSNCVAQAARLHYMHFDGVQYYNSWVWDSTRAISYQNAVSSPAAHHYGCRYTGTCGYWEN